MKHRQTQAPGKSLPRRQKPLTQALLTAAVMLTLSFAIPAHASQAQPSLSKSELARKLAAEFGLDAAYVRHSLRTAKFRPEIVERMEQPFEAQPYRVYRKSFVNAERIRLGREYMKKHSRAFARAYQKYGVQPEIIAAIIGVETLYGQRAGKERLLDALYTLSTGYPRRSAFFRKELGYFLEMCRQENINPAMPTGSMAGAFGIPQFMPSSFHNYAVDGNGDGRRDLWNSPDDAIFSVANYFSRYRWDGTRPIVYWLKKRPSHGKLAELYAKNTTQWTEFGSLRNTGLPRIWHDDDRISLIELETDKGMRAAIVHYNFRVIMRYNRSHNYAMAVSELAAGLGCRTCVSSS